MNCDDNTLTRQDYRQPFVLSADDQAFHEAKGFTNEPKRCSSRHRARRSEPNGGYGQGPCEMHPTAIARYTVAIASVNSTRAHGNLVEKRYNK